MSHHVAKASDRPTEAAVQNAERLPRWMLWLGCLVFVAMLFTDLGISGWVAYKTNGNWCVLDLSRDLLVTPVRRHGELVRNLNGLLTAEMPPDSLRSWACDGASAVVSVNRHVRLDSSDVQVMAWRTLCDEATRMADAAMVGDPWKRDSLTHAAKIVEGNLASLPAAYLQALFSTAFSAHYLRAWEASLKDQSPLVSTLRKWVLAGDYLIFHDLGRKGVQGHEGWVFYRPGIDYQIRYDVRDPRSRSTDANDARPADNPLPAIVSFRDQLRAKGIDLMVVVTPNKESVYPELLAGESGKGLELSLPHTRAFFGALDSLGIDHVDLFPAFATAKEHDGDSGRLYLSHDTHWSPRGAALAAELVARHIRSLPGWASGDGDSFPKAGVEFQKQTGFETLPVSVERKGDILEMTQLADLEIAGKVRIRFAPETVVAHQVDQVKHDSVGAVIWRRRNRDEFRASRILILGDSFSRIYHTDAPEAAGWTDLLAARLGEPVGAVVSEGGASTLVREKLARRSGVLRGKSLVVWEFVERDLRFGEGGWKDVEIP